MFCSKCLVLFVFSTFVISLNGASLSADDEKFFIKKEYGTKFDPIMDKMNLIVQKLILSKLTLQAHEQASMMKLYSLFYENSALLHQLFDKISSEPSVFLNEFLDLILVRDDMMDDLLQIINMGKLNSFVNKMLDSMLNLTETNINCNGTNCNITVPSTNCNGTSCNITVPQTNCNSTSCNITVPTTNCNGTTCNVTAPPSNCNSTSCNVTLPTYCNGTSCSNTSTPIYCNGTSCNVTVPITTCNGTSCSIEQNNSTFIPLVPTNNSTVPTIIIDSDVCRTYHSSQCTQLQVANFCPSLCRCGSLECKNNGTAVATTTSDCICLCKSPFSGKYCETKECIEKDFCSFFTSSDCNIEMIKTNCPKKCEACGL